MRWLIALVLLVCGCLTQQTVEKYVCSDGWVTDTQEGCGGHERDCPRCAQTVCKCQACNNTIQYIWVTNATNSIPTSTTLATESDFACLTLGCPPGSQYVSSKSSGKYHRCDCKYATTLSKKNLICYKSAEEAQAAGKQPCGICSKS